MGTRKGNVTSELKKLTTGLGGFLMAYDRLLTDNVRTLEKAMKQFLEFTMKYGMPTTGLVTEEGFDQTIRRKGEVHLGFCQRRNDLLNALSNLVDSSCEQSERLKAYRLILELSDFLQVCACSPVWKQPERRVHVLDDLYTDLVHRFELWNHIKWTPLPARFHKDGLYYLLNALGKGIIHAYLMFSRDVEYFVTVRLLSQFLERLIEHVVPGTEGIQLLELDVNALSPTYIILQILEERTPGILSSALPAPGAKTHPLSLSYGLKPIPPRFQLNTPTAQIMETTASYLGPDNKPHQFHSWRGAIWLRQTQRMMSDDPSALEIETVVSQRLKDCYHFHLSEEDQERIRKDIEEEIPKVRTSRPRAKQPLSQDCFWRIYRSGKNIFQGAQDSRDKKVPSGRYTLSTSDGQATTLYFATTAACSMAELFDDEPLLCLPDVTTKSLALVTWTDAQKADILDLDELFCSLERVPEDEKDSLRQLSWTRSVYFAKAALDAEFDGVRYASAKGTTDRNIAIFSYGAEPSVPGDFTIERTKRLVNSAEFWAYIAEREQERPNSICFTRLPDDISLLEIEERGPQWPDLIASSS